NDWLKLTEGQWQIPEDLISAFRHVILDESLDMDLRAELLSPPGFEELAATLSVIDPVAVEAVRDHYRLQLGLSLQGELHALYTQLWQQEDNSMNGRAYGRRKLRNVCLWLLMKAKESAVLDACQQQFVQSKTMTDQIASFALLTNCSDAEIRKKAVAGFYQQWSLDDLVLDKWFMIQATAEQPNTLEEVRHLLKHPAFSIKNPNKVRALVGAFCMGNPRNFHEKGGSGYAFLTEMLIALDAINPQMSARLATPFTRWQRFDKPRQALMKQQLEILSKLALSSDLRELVDKSLIV
ncbi:MAG: aminopeptidase N C-terminal domain-containing protein, partial [Legionellales bacterium]